MYKRQVLDTPLEVNLNMTDLNCQAVVAMCQITAPYMPRGSQIINIASVCLLYTSMVSLVISIMFLTSKSI